MPCDEAFSVQTTLFITSYTVSSVSRVAQVHACAATAHAVLFGGIATVIVSTVGRALINYAQIKGRSPGWSDVRKEVGPPSYFRVGIIVALVTALVASSLGMPRIETLIGDGSAGAGLEDSRASIFQINSPFGVIEAPDGTIYICDTGSHRVLTVNESGSVHIVAGTGKPGYSGDGGPAKTAQLNEPYEVRRDTVGNLYVVERLNHTIRKVNARDGRISTVAGTGKAGYSGDDGPATDAMLNQPHSIAIGPAGARLFVCDIGNHRIRVIDLKSGQIETFAGTGRPLPPVDGARFAGSDLMGPRCLAFDAKGNGWLSLREGRAIYRLDLAKGTLHHVSGSGKKGFEGDGSPAKDATLSGPLGLAVSPVDGNLYFCDTNNHAVRMIDLTCQPATIHTVAGTGKAGDGDDGPPLECELARPHGIYVNDLGEIFIGDTNNHRVRVIRQ